MKKQFPTVFHETALLYGTICVSAGKIGHQVECDPNALSLIHISVFRWSLPKA